MFRDSIIELDRAAKSFDLHDIDTGALCLRKALEGHTEMAAPQPTPNPFRTDTRAELSKSVSALETKDFEVSALCLEKALEGAKSLITPATYDSMTRFAQAVRRENPGSMATYLREALTSLVGDRVIEPTVISS